MRVDRATRFISAPPETVYAAFVDPQAIVRWLPPNGATAILQQFEPRPDGAIRMTLIFKTADGTKRKTTNDSDDVVGRFTKLIYPTAIEQEFTFISDDPQFSGLMTMTWSFIGQQGGTRVAVEARDVPKGVKPDEHQAGMNSSLANLSAYVENQAGRRYNK